VALITLAEAVMLAGVSSRVIHQWIESGSIHFAETSGGMALVCPASLLSRIEARPLSPEKNDERPAWPCPDP
jgi:hypothetical protein